jgi:hypothetical protein
LNNNNRNNRRRGRGNRNQGGNGNQLNRIDSRARGNAPQMLEKYRKLAQDAQHNGDRVQMEYYLQFADHYFRVIADNKARAEEQRGGARRHEEREAAEDFDDDFDFDRGRRSDTPTRTPYEQPRAGAEAEIVEGEPRQEGESFLAAEPQGDEAEPREEARGRGRRQQRKARDGGERPRKAERDAAADETGGASGSGESGESGEARPARGRRPRRRAEDSARTADQNGIDSSILPPPIRSDDAGGESGALEAVE